MDATYPKSKPSLLTRTRSLSVKLKLLLCIYCGKSFIKSIQYFLNGFGEWWICDRPLPRSPSQAPPSPLRPLQGWSVSGRVALWSLRRATIPLLTPRCGGNSGPRQSQTDQTGYNKESSKLITSIIQHKWNIACIIWEFPLHPSKRSPAWEITLCPSKRFRKLKSDALANARTFYTSRQDSEGSCAPQ